MANRISTTDVGRLQSDPGPSGGEPGNQTRALFRHALGLLGLTDPRTSTRCRCALPVPYRLVNLHSTDFGLARILNISRGGAQLLAEEAIVAGEFMAVILGRRSAAFPGPMVLRVVHSTRVARGRWLLGGAWGRELAAQQLRTLLP